ncbi:oligosaccharide flippase family protein [Mangrovibacillus cuniculi]|uniref:oligosaccharide flippase family protein n=1 Tax=Mangrovibacillus cuniculi TaxID=2593652 RepID=UPI003084673B
MSSKLLRGTFILTLGTFVSKFLGLFYIIPFVMIIGADSEDFLQLYNYGYVPYTIFISIATGGLPLAVSKYIAKYNAVEEYAIGRKLFRSSVKLMLLSGTLAFLFLFLLAPLYVKLAIGDLNGGPFTEKDVINVIRTVSFALILVPFLSIIRGFFQGHQSMGPSSVSQVVEQIVRIAFLLTGAFLVVKVFGVAEY